MASLLAVLIHFEGEPDELLERFERARRRGVEAQEDSYDAPAFYAACSGTTASSCVTRRRGGYRWLETEGSSSPRRASSIRRGTGSSPRPQNERALEPAPRS
jgi:hypothetical protein